MATKAGSSKTVKALSVLLAVGSLAVSLAAQAAVISAQDRAALSGVYGPTDMGPSPLTSNNPADATPSVTDWRVTQGLTFNGVNFDGNVRLNFDNDGNLANGGFVCSGTLIGGGRYVLTAAHCADDHTAPGFVMEIRSGIYGNVTATTQSILAGNVHVHPGWDGSLSKGNDIAVIELTNPIYTATSFNLSTANDVGKTFLMMGHGTTQLGNVNAGTNWNDYGWAHYGWNQIDATTKQFLDAALAMGLPSLGTWSNADGEEYVADFDGLQDLSAVIDPAVRHNTLGRITGLTSSQGLGIPEALIAGGDSGGGDFIWNGTEWLLAGVHSWGWQFCGGRLTTPQSCDGRTSNTSSWGDLMGSTAVFSHVNWINSIAVPEPGTIALLGLSLGLAGMVSRPSRCRRRQD